MFGFKVALFGAVSALSLSSAAFAADAEAPSVDELVVTGRRPIAESVAAALEAQRSSDSLVSVLSADAAGNLPDQNIAYAIGRLPGVAVQRDQGQARYINLRGAPVYWTTLSFDGLSVVSPQGRDSRFDNIPTAIASQITVEKAITPNLAGASVAGNIDIRTRRAFDYPGQTFTGKLGYGKVELGGGKEFDSSLVYSNIFADGKLGIVAQGSYYMREMATDNWETDPYLSNTVDPSKHFAREHENKHYRLTRENISGSLRADYRIDENNSVFASTIYTQYHDDELRDNFIFRLDQGTNAAGAGYASAANITASDPTFGVSYGARINARIDYRDSVEEMSTTTLGGEHSWSGWDVSWRANYTDTSDGRDAPLTAALQSPSSFLLRPTVQYDFRDGDVNTVKLFQTLGTTTARVMGAQVTDIEAFQFPLTSIGNLVGADITQAWTGKLDISRETELFGRETKVQFGVLYTDRQKKSREAGYTKSFTTGTIPTWSTFATDIGYLGTQNLNYTFRYTDKGFTTAFVNNLIATGQATRTDTRGNYYLVGEELAALYAMATTQFDWGNIVYGARVEQVKNTGQAYVTFPAAGTTPANTRLVQTSSEDTMVYPSVHLNWNVNDEVKARLSFTTSASRPDFDDLRPNFTINDATQSISGGNPEAKPEKQIGLDAYVEWYMTPSGFLSAGIFYKDIADVLVKRSSVYGATTLNVPGIDRSGYAYNAIGNGGDGHLQGLELAYTGTIETFAQANNLPEWMEGFGTSVSATFTSSEVSLPANNGVASRKISLLGSSDAVYNVQATYEKYGLSVRLAYQYRTPWGESVGDYQTIAGGVYPVDNGDIFWDADEELDFSARYQVNDILEIYVDGANLTNQGSRRYGDQSRYPIEFEKFGRRYTGGVRFKF
ncbi:TonB-dependent receptor [Phenylobacterium sp. 20VBR1]|uniref:TonB-dependent receptor n=1 Tax=Phenylobacterium glaciei TaxID=2803784 RepID=A0A941D425_9CAUL|nr:TonB-dependent receptor [Phenylobacterium glaciei]MBR7620443.1 TonB-dependent receptor [Phenylobacterium glaciei]